jgi:outer membrane protein assembly factor BamB
MNIIKATNKAIRVLPGIIIAILLWILWFLVPQLTTGGTAMVVSVFGGLACSFLILIWWVFFSRAGLVDRLLAVAVMLVALVIFNRFTHDSIKTGMSGLMYFIYAVPILSISFVIWAAVSRNMSKMLKRLTMILSIVFACGFWTLLRSEGITGNASAIFEWRWAKTNEEKLLSQSEEVLTKRGNLKETDANWPGFRGPNRDNKVRGVKIETDWTNSPPVELWRKPIGPGCSSFAVLGSVFYTQEQRGDDEVVSCYNLETGEAIWKHSDKARFWDSHAGAGPRSTPYIQDSLLYTLGATGILNVLNLYNGKLIWSKNAAEDIQDTIPGWGYTSSPVVIDSVIIVAVSGTLVAYDAYSGELKWRGPDGGENYSSPHFITIGGVKQVLMMSENAVNSFNPANGEILWQRKWGAGAIVQPAMTDEGDILISEGYKKGIHRIHVSKNSGNWIIKDLWMTSKIRPDFNDFVVHKGFLYGFEGLSLTCIDLNNGERKWKAGRYGGQVLILTDQDLLLVLSEKGELVLLEANSEKLTELAKFQAIEGKTWNHHVLVNDIILVRNTQEMAAFRLTLANN